VKAKTFMCFPLKQFLTDVKHHILVITLLIIQPIFLELLKLDIILSLVKFSKLEI